MLYELVVLLSITDSISEFVLPQFNKQNKTKQNDSPKFIRIASPHLTENKKQTNKRTNKETNKNKETNRMLRGPLLFEMQRIIN